MWAVGVKELQLLLTMYVVAFLLYFYFIYNFFYLKELTQFGQQDIQTSYCISGFGLLRKYGVIQGEEL